MSLTDRLEAQPKIQAAWLFGSGHTGRARPDSDVDIGLLTSEPLTTEELIDLAGRLERELGVERVDLVELEAASPVLAFEAISGRSLLNRDPHRVAAFVSLTSRIYEDTMATLERGLTYWKQAR